MKTLIFGCGFVGTALAEQLIQQGHEVIGVRRSKLTAREEKKPIRFLQADVAVRSTFDRLPMDCDWIVDCVSASGGGVDEYERVYVDGVRNLLEWLSSQKPKKFVYTSSTGVYGQDDGSVVDETCPTAPYSETGKVLVRAEELILAAARTRNLPGVVLRLSGIYGPGRGYWLRQFLAGEARLEGDGSRILNMIHREDAAGAILAALERGAPAAVYNVSDNEPVRQRELLQWLAAKLNRPLPGGASEEPRSGATRRTATNKAISNKKLRTELCWEPRFPTFREGYAAELVTLGRALL